MIVDRPVTAFTADFNIGALGPSYVGSTSWTVKCRNLTAGTGSQADSGTIQIN
jgi:hypothetical protein